MFSIRLLAKLEAAQGLTLALYFADMQTLLLNRHPVNLKWIAKA